MKPLVTGNRLLLAGFVYPSACPDVLDFRESQLLNGRRLLTAKLGLIMLVKLPTHCRESDLELGARERRSRECNRESGPGQFHDNLNSLNQFPVQS